MPAVGFFKTQNLWAELKTNVFFLSFFFSDLIPHKVIYFRDVIWLLH